MAENDFSVEKNVSQASQNTDNTSNTENGGSKSSGKIIDESNYRIHAPREKGPTAIGRGGDPFFRHIGAATREQLTELIEETQTVQDWIQRETSNNVALSCLKENNLNDVYYKMKDGFLEYGKISLMGFKTPSGVEIPRLKIYDTDGNVLEVLSGPLALDELNRRALAYNEYVNGYEEVPDIGTDIDCVIADYTGNPTDYST